MPSDLLMNKSITSLSLRVIRISSLAALAALAALLLPACSGSPAAPDETPEAEHVGASASALCFPAVYSGTVQVGTQYVSWPSPANYQSSCDGLFWTQATIGANTGPYKRFWASVDMRVAMPARECGAARVLYQLWGKLGANWVSLNSVVVNGGTFNAVSGICSINATYALPLVTAQSYSEFMLGGSATSPNGTWPILDTLGLDY
jgi:hypothetical protein